MAYHTKEWGPPFGGGWMEWPAGLVTRMSTVYAYTRAFQAYNANKGDPQWVNRNTETFELITHVWGWRKALGQDWW